MRAKTVLALCSLLVASACGSKPESTNSLPTQNSPVAVKPGTGSGAVQNVTIDSPDGVRIVGSFFASSTPNSPGLLLLHQWQSDRHSYDEFAKRMQAKGFNVLSIDGRGFGESTRKTDGTTVTAERSDEAVKAMLGDVDAAVWFLSKQKNVDPIRIGIVGASYGSSLAIMYAADHPDIHVVALLSPGLNYFGNMQTRPAVEKYRDRDLFIVASKGDTESAQAVEGLTIGDTRHGFMVLPVGSFHGTDMFKYRDKTDGPAVVEDALESFLTTRMGL
jgi:dienelactone hydrolase